MNAGEDCQHGSYLPPRVETAEDLAPRVGRSARWIERRTGVKERRISDESMDLMGARAAKAALGDGPPPDLVINASLTPIQLIPDSSIFIQKRWAWKAWVRFRSMRPA